MTDNSLNLICLVDGEATSNAFSVKIPSNDSVDDLKKLIKTEKSVAFDDIPANKLTLWRVSIPVVLANKHNPIVLNEIDSPTELDPTELDPTDDISDVFEDQPPKKTIHIMVQRPPRGTALGLSYRRPAPQLRTTGMNWTYQPDPELYDTLREEIKDHYRDFSRGLIDKSTIPLYLFLGGAGTGKSRNAQEFHQPAISCLTEEDRDLRNKIKHAWVFHVSFEKGTSPWVKETDHIKAIGKRMLLQLLPDMRLRDVMQSYEEVHPMRVLDLVARGTGQDLRSATVILIVDGLQSFMTGPKDGHNKYSTFYRALTNSYAIHSSETGRLACRFTGVPTYLSGWLIRAGL
ncbi:hypothetical protein BG003_010841 [Podila horticola]|nr:hypothetical protein BG003_010841 [Podila horticola]